MSACPQCHGSGMHTRTITAGPQMLIDGTQAYNPSPITARGLCLPCSGSGKVYKGQSIGYRTPEAEAFVTEMNRLRADRDQARREADATLHAHFSRYGCGPQKA